MVGWELARREANIMPEEMTAIRQFGTPLAQFALDCNRRALEAGQEQSGDPGLGLCDPVAMAVALEPSGRAKRDRVLGNRHPALEGDALQRAAIRGCGLQPCNGATPYSCGRMFSGIIRMVGAHIAPDIDYFRQISLG
jgi:hypothetical protein